MANERLRHRLAWRGPVASVASAQIRVLGNGVEISDGDSTPSLTDHTDFGSVTEGGSPIARAYAVSNPGAADLNISGVSVPSGFSVINALPATIIAGPAPQTLTIEMVNTPAGTYSGTVSITHDAPGSPFDFAITGTVDPPAPPPPPPPPPGDGVARWSMTTDFGTQRQSTGNVDRTLRIYNASDTDALSTSGLSVPSGMSVVGSLPATIDPLEWADVTVRMADSTAGSKSGDITLTTSDPDNTTLTIPVTGTVAATGTEVLLATETRRNLTGSTLAKPPVKFLLMLNPGELPTTETLVLRLSDETLIATTHWQWGERSTYPDGSLRAAVVRCYGPASWANNTDFTVKVYKAAGSWPAETNARTTADVTSNSDRDVRFLDVRAAYDSGVPAADALFSQPTVGSGEFYNSLNDDIANASAYKRTAGGICTQWYCWSKSRDVSGGAEDADLKVIHYVEVWTDPDAGSAVKWISWEPIISNGQWHDSGSRSRSVLYDLRVYEANSSIRDWKKEQTLAAAAVNVGGSTLNIDTAPIPNLVPQSAGALIFGGANPPGGITAGKYYGYKQGSGFGFGKTISITDTANTGSGGPWGPASTSNVVFSSNGGGTFTISCRTMHPMGRFYPLREDDGFEHWILVDGVASTGAGPKIVPNWSETQQIERKRRGQLMPIPIRTMSGSLAPTYSAEYTNSGVAAYAPWAKVWMPRMNTTIYKNSFDAGSVDNATGDSTSYGVDVLRSMTSLPHHAQLRLMANDWACFPNIRLYDGATNSGTGLPYNRLRPSNNGPDKAGASYTGLNAPRPSLKCGDAGSTNDYIVTPASHFYGTNTNGNLAGGVDGTHTCPANIEAFALYASPVDLHFTVMMAALGIQYPLAGLNSQVGGGRDREHAGVRYYHVHAIGDGLHGVQTGRANAQIMRFLASAVTAPDSEPETAFFKDVLKDNLDYANLAMQTPAIVGPVHKALGIIGEMVTQGDGGGGTQQGWFNARWLTCTLFALKRYGGTMSHDLLDFYTNSIMGVSDRKRTGVGRVIQAKPHMISYYLGWQYLLCTSDNTAFGGVMDDSRHNASVGWSGMGFTSSSSAGQRIVKFRNDSLVEKYEQFPTTNDAPPFTQNGDSFHLGWYTPTRASLPAGIAQSVVYHCYDRVLYARVARVTNLTGISVGDTITQGGNSATVVRLTWAATALDYFLYFTPPTPGPFTAGPISSTSGGSATYPSTTYDGAALYKICTDPDNAAATRVTWTGEWTDNRSTWRYTGLGNSPNGWSLGTNTAIDYAMQQFNPAAAAYTWFSRHDVAPIFSTYAQMMSEARGLPDFEGGTYRNNYYQTI